MKKHPRNILVLSCLQHSRASYRKHTLLQTMGDFIASPANHQRRATNHQRRATDHQRRATDHQRRATDHQRRATNHQRRATDHQRRATNHQRRATNHQRRVEGINNGGQTRKTIVRRVSMITHCITYHTQYSTHSARALTQTCPTMYVRIAFSSTCTCTVIVVHVHVQ